MKYFSETLKQLFDTPEELAEAEAAVTHCSCEDCDDEICSCAECKNEEPCQKSPAVVEEKRPSKKQLAADIDAADEEVRKAYSEYELAKKNVEELSKQYLEAVDAILNPAKQAIKDAEQKRYNAINKFNQEYGAYQVTYTGARAAEEMVKAINDLNSRTRNMFRNMFWY